MTQDLTQDFMPAWRAKVEERNLLGLNREDVFRKSMKLSAMSTIRAEEVSEVSLRERF
jgi:hypothetical protein